MRVTELTIQSDNKQAKFHSIMQKWHKIFKNGPILTHSPEEMKQLGREIGKILHGGEVLGLVGNLGAGKTHLTQGIMEGLEVGDSAASPTFSLVHEHTDGRLPVCHFDFYRLKDESELYGIGWDDYLDRGDILVVEWANLCPNAMPHDTKWVLIEHQGPTMRLVTLDMEE